MSKLLTQINKAPKETKKISDAFEIIDGDRGVNYPSKSEFTNNGYCVFLNTKNIPSQGFDFSNADFISKERDELLRKGKLSRNDIVMTTRGTIGNVALYSENIPFNCMRINSGMVVLRSKEDYDRNYLYSVIKSNTFNSILKNTSSGSAQPQLPIKDLKEIELKIPDLPTQKKIAEILSAYDAKIENNNSIIKNLEMIAQTIFNEWFVSFKFPGYEKTKMVDSEMGEIPEGWSVKNVMEVVERIGVGKKYDNKTALPVGETPILDQGQSGFIGYHNEEPSVIASIEKPVVVFTNHTCYYRLLTEPFSCIQNVLPYVGKDGYDTLFVYFLTKEKIKMSEYKGHWPEFEQQAFVISPLDLANLFAQKARVFIEKIVTTEKENISLKFQRDQLLKKLI